MRQPHFVSIQDKRPRLLDVIGGFQCSSHVSCSIWFFWSSLYIPSVSFDPFGPTQSLHVMRSPSFERLKSNVQIERGRSTPRIRLRQRSQSYQRVLPIEMTLEPRTRAEGPPVVLLEWFSRPATMPLPLGFRLFSGEDAHGPKPSSVLCALRSGCR